MDGGLAAANSCVLEAASKQVADSVMSGLKIGRDIVALRWMTVGAEHLVRAGKLSRAACGHA